MNLPPNAIKDHSFSLYKEHNSSIFFFKCSKCNVICVYPDYPDNLHTFRQQDFYYFFDGCSWNDVFIMNNLSCNEIIIRNIIL